MKTGGFLPTTIEEMHEKGWDELDFLFISGEAYVDHPSFGTAIITRLLENAGFKVGIIDQPDWRSTEDFKRMGKPRYGVLISSGVVDSMVNHYTAGKKPRSSDEYSPGGKAGLRPDRAVIVYANRAREAFKDVPVIIGGIEASLRRFAHYDYWDNKVRRSVLVDSKADLLVYGMGEKPIIEIARLLEKNVPVKKITGVRGTVYSMNKDRYDQKQYEMSERDIILASYEEVQNDKIKYAEAFRIQYEEQNASSDARLIQKHGDTYIVQNPPVRPMTVEEMDKVYSLPYERTYHPKYEGKGGVPAIEEVEFSITSHRGCIGACSFCALTFHQGRSIQKRSRASIINEAKKLVWLPGFKGYIHDIGGPTANFRNAVCMRKDNAGGCKSKTCLSPKACANLQIDHMEYLKLLREVRSIPGIKKVFIRSGIRYDYLMLDKNDEFFNELCEHHVSGQLKVAPEHVVDYVLKRMNKPERKVYDRFVKKFYEINKKIGKEQYLVPYLISSHPGSDLAAAVELALYLKDIGYMPEQVQDFYPTPGTLSTCMFYTGIDPRTMEKVYVPRSPEEKKMQRALLQYRKPENYDIVKKALIKAGRQDLIGYGKDCLIRPYPPSSLRRNPERERSQSSGNKVLKRKDAGGAYHAGKNIGRKSIGTANKRAGQKRSR